MQLLAILAACAVLIGVIVLYYHYFDPMHIDEEEEQSVEKETESERIETLAKREREIEEAKIEGVTHLYSDQ